MSMRLFLQNVLITNSWLSIRFVTVFSLFLMSSDLAWVTRDVIDIFRIGEEGCLINKSVCTTTASWQNDGSCLCNEGTPHFRNPI